MNTSYNYADFIGVELNENNEHETCVDSKIHQQGIKGQTCENAAWFNDELNKDKTVEYETPAERFNACVSSTS